MSENQISINNLSKVYDNGFKALNNCGFFFFINSNENEFPVLDKI